MMTVSREAVARFPLSASSRGGNPKVQGGSRHGRKWSRREIAIAVRLRRAMRGGLRISYLDIAAQLGRSVSAVKSKISRKKEGDPYRKSKTWIPGRRRRVDREAA